MRLGPYGHPSGRSHTLLQARDLDRDANGTSLPTPQAETEHAPSNPAFRRSPRHCSLPLLLTAPTVASATPCPARRAKIAIGSASSGKPILLRDTMIELGELCRLLTPLRFEQGCGRALADEQHRNEHQIGFFRSLPAVYSCPAGINLVETIQPRRLGNPPPRNGAFPIAPEET